VRGELSLLGYSAYLHPAGENLIIGVGQDATETGRAKGTQVALYDVSDLANPRELQKYVLWNSTSEVEQAFHAFMWWEPTKLAMVPVDRAYVGLIDGACPKGPTTGACPQTYIPPFTGAIGLTIDRNGISELGRVVNPGPASINRCGSGALDDCVPSCPPDANCTGVRVDTSGGTTPGTPVPPVDCSKESCGPVTTTTTTAPLPTTVPCPPDAGCAPPVPPRTVPPCRVVERAAGSGVSSCPSDTGARIERSLVVGDTVFTFSENGIKSSELATLHEKYWLPFR
jgi:hypothetical protein